MKSWKYSDWEIIDLKILLLCIKPTDDSIQLSQTHPIFNKSRSFDRKFLFPGNFFFQKEIWQIFFPKNLIHKCRGKSLFSLSSYHTATGRDEECSEMSHIFEESGGQWARWFFKEFRRAVGKKINNDNNIWLIH